MTLPVKMYLHYPAVAAVVSVRHDGRDNALACVWHTALSFDPPLYAVSVSPKRFSFGLMQAAEYFAVNFLPFEKADLIARFGRNSGRDLDKFSAWDVPLRETDAPAPILADAYAVYLCRKVEQHTYGDHDLFIGQIERVFMDEGAFTPQNTLDVAHTRPALYLGANHYITTGGKPEFHDGQS